VSEAVAGAPGHRRSGHVTRAQAFALLAAVTVIWGVNWSAVKLAVDELLVLTFSTLRLVFAGIGMLAICRLGRLPLRVPRRGLHRNLSIRLDSVSPQSIRPFGINAGLRYGRATSLLLLFLLPIFALAQLPEAQLQDLNLGAQLARTGQYREGLRVASDATKRFPSDARVFQMLGYFQTKLQLNQAAVQSYSRALDLDPDNRQLQNKFSKAKG